MTDGPAGDALRGTVVAGLIALLTAAGHTAGGGAAPDLTVVVVLLPLLSYALAGIAGRCRSVAGTVAVLGAGQFVLHVLMELWHPAPHAAGPRMFVLHAAATLVTALALRHADRGVAALAAALRRVVPRRLHPPPADRPLPVLAVAGPALPARLARTFAVAHVRRGPPAGC